MYSIMTQLILWVVMATVSWKMSTVSADVIYKMGKMTDNQKEVT